MNTIAIINIARQQLRMDDAVYRAMLVRVTGRDSLRAMSERQRIDVVDELKRLGFRVTTSKSGKAFPAANKPYIRLIHALWKSCHRKGVIRDGSREALRTFVRNTLHERGSNVVTDPDLLSFEQASPVIEALKAMERRAA